MHNVSIGTRVLEMEKEKKKFSACRIVRVKLRTITA